MVLLDVYVPIQDRRPRHLDVRQGADNISLHLRAAFAASSCCKIIKWFPSVGAARRAKAPVAASGPTFRESAGHPQQTIWWPLGTGCFLRAFSQRTTST